MQWNVYKFSYDYIYICLLVRNILTQISKGKHLNVPHQQYKLLS